MNRTLLYYPTIEIPQRSWLRNALLYWDQVSSIVPQGSTMSPEISYLMAEEQFRPVEPGKLFGNRQHSNLVIDFQEEFKKQVASFRFSEKSPKLDVRYRIHLDKVKTAIVHRSSGDPKGVLDFLEELGLSKKFPGDQWVVFQRDIGLTYMALLAKYLAEIDSNITSIGTDLVAYEKLNFRRVSESKGLPVVSFNICNVSSCTIRKCSF